MYKLQIAFILGIIAAVSASENTFLGEKSTNENKLLQ